MQKSKDVQRHVLKGNESYADLCSLIRESCQDQVVFYVPSDPQFLIDDPDAFVHLLEFSKEVKKDFLIETDDDFVAELARSLGLSVLPHRSSKIFYDVIPPKDFSLGKSLDNAHTKEPSPAYSKVSFFDGWAKKRAAISSYGFRLSSASRVRVYAFLVLSCLVVVGAVSLFSVFFPRVVIAVKLKTFDVEFDQKVVVRSKPEVSAFKNALFLQGSIFSVTSTLPTSSVVMADVVSKVPTKASGKVVVYNRSVRSSVTLVARSRILSSASLIYYTRSRVTVPAYDPKNPDVSRVEVEVEAEKSGDQYNVSASNEAWHFLGLKGSAQYEQIVVFPQFALTKGASNFTSPALVVNPQFRPQLVSLLRDAVFSSHRNPHLNLIDDAVSVIRSSQDPSVSVLTTMLFDEEGLKKQLMPIIFSKLPDERKHYEIEKIELSYSLLRFVPHEDLMEFTVHVRAPFQSSVSVADVLDLVRGKDESSLKASLLSLTDVEAAEVSLWPRWFRTVPMSSHNVQVHFE